MNTGSLTQTDIECIICKEIPKVFLTVCSNLHIICEECINSYYGMIDNNVEPRIRMCPMRCVSTMPPYSSFNLTNIVMKTCGYVKTTCEKCKFTGTLLEYCKHREGGKRIHHHDIDKSIRPPKFTLCGNVDFKATAKEYGVIFTPYKKFSIISRGPHVLLNLYEEDENKNRSHYVLLIKYVFGNDGYDYHLFSNRADYALFSMDTDKKVDTAFIRMSRPPNQNLEIKTKVHNYWDEFPDIGFSSVSNFAVLGWDKVRWFENKCQRYENLELYFTCQDKQTVTISVHS